MLSEESDNFSQEQLMQKFNLAFFEGQNRNCTIIDETNDNLLIDYLISDSPSIVSNNFDFNDFVEIFNENQEEECCDNFSSFFVAPPPFNHTNFDDFDINDLELSETISNQSLDFIDNFDLNDLNNDILPSIATITKNNLDFNTFLRSTASDDLNYFCQDTPPKNNFGHLIGSKLYSNEETEISNNDNQLILPQDDALLFDDPFLTNDRERFVSETSSSSSDSDTQNPLKLQCLWEKCHQLYETQTALVKHIEKCHVEVKRGDEFTCYWQNCPRKIKPFNARYKLLIHMRVHSGEKPNKCPFQGCNKAFSRLENLKIHQRSHTGERPYLCQYPTCTKSFSNSSDRAKHQRTHFDTKPYACQINGCTKKYTDPSSLRKHVKNHTYEEQMLLKKRQTDNDNSLINNNYAKQFLDLNKQKAIKFNYTNLEHNYSNNCQEKQINSHNIKQDLKNKLRMKLEF